MLRLHLLPRLRFRPRLRLRLRLHLHHLHLHLHFLVGLLLLHRTAPPQRTYLTALAQSQELPRWSLAPPYRRRISSTTHPAARLALIGIAYLRLLHLITNVLVIDSARRSSRS